MKIKSIKAVGSSINRVTATIQTDTVSFICKELDKNPVQYNGVFEFSFTCDYGNVPALLDIKFDGGLDISEFIKTIIDSTLVISSQDTEMIIGAGFPSELIIQTETPWISYVTPLILQIVRGRLDVHGDKFTVDSVEFKNNI